MASNSILERQNQLRLSNIGCDVIFEIGAKSFPAHRVVLMAQLEYFQKMFTADMREKKELTVQFDPLIIDPGFFGDVLNYVYTSKIEFTLDNLRPIFKAADYFCFDELTTKVKEQMEGSLKIENAVLYRNISVEFNLKSFEDTCQQFIIDNLSSDVVKNQLIPTLSFEELKSFNDKLKGNSMFEDMFHYSVGWILHDKDNRSETLLELLKNISLESLSFQFIKETVSKQEIVMKDNDCLTLLFNLLLNISQPLPSQNSSIDGLYAIGGSDGEELSSVSVYNSEWTTTTPMPSPLSHFGCAVIEQKIYVCGGYNGYRCVNKLTAFDPHTRTWTQLTPMKHTRQLCAVAALNEQIYVAGGEYDGGQLTVVERYNLQTDQWSEIAPMTTKRYGHELVALNELLYAIGGHDGEDALNSVERYDPQTDQWTVMNNMNNKYHGFGSAVLNDIIYIVGKDTCEAYWVTDDKWNEMPAPSKCGLGRRLAVYNGKLYATGGLVGELELWKGSKTVEVLGFQPGVWPQEPDMDVARCYHQLALVKK